MHGMTYGDALKTIIITFSVLTLACLPSFSQPKDASVNLPATPVGQHAQAYLKAFNSSDEGSMRSFFEEHVAKSALKDVPLEERLSRFRQMKQRLGSLQVKKVIESSRESVLILVLAKGGNSMQLSFQFESQAPFGLLGIRVEDLGEGDEGIGTPSRKADDAEVVAATRSFLDSLAKIDQFSGVALLARKGMVVFEGAYGYADRERKIPNRTDTRFNLGSINKRFTKTAIHQLAAQGKLALTDPIRKFLPDYPNKEAADKVTVKHLLDMQSGIGDFFGERYQTTPKEKLRSISDYLPLFADKPLEFEPGTGRRYSNGGYVVLGAIIEKASGRDYYTFVRENIFAPAGMASTESFEKDKEVANRALGYTRDNTNESWRSNYATLPAKGSSAGGGYSTAHDLLRFIGALEARKIPAPDTEQGLGIAGGAPGMNAALEWEPKTGYVIVVLSNFDPPAAEQVARQIRAWLPQSAK
jgi:CubicO group peptidase (beta-lactamase class C family)